MTPFPSFSRAVDAPSSMDFSLTYTHTRLLSGYFRETLIRSVFALSHPRTYQINFTISAGVCVVTILHCGRFSFGIERENFLIKVSKLRRQTSLQSHSRSPASFSGVCESGASWWVALSFFKNHYIISIKIYGVERRLLLDGGAKFNQTLCFCTCFGCSCCWCCFSPPCLVFLSICLFI